MRLTPLNNSKIVSVRTRLSAASALGAKPPHRTLAKAFTTEPHSTTVSTLHSASRSIPGAARPSSNTVSTLNCATASNFGSTKRHSKSMLGVRSASSTGNYTSTPSARWITPSHRASAPPRSCLAPPAHQEPHQQLFDELRRAHLPHCQHANSLAPNDTARVQAPTPSHTDCSY